MEEIWKLVPGFSRYEASSFGRIRSAKNKRLRKNQILRGYFTIQVRSDENKVMCTSVHRLVAYAFLGEPTAATVNHKNFDKKDNRPENLEYMSIGDNFRHAYAAGLIPKISDPSRRGPGGPKGNKRL